jgi:hypothetical protein
MFPDGLPDLVGEHVENLLVVIRRDRRSPNNPELDDVGGQLSFWERFWPEGPREVCLEEGFEDLAGQDYHAESECKG